MFEEELRTHYEGIGGLAMGGGWGLMGTQLVAAGAIILWTLPLTLAFLYVAASCIALSSPGEAREPGRP